MGHRPGDEHFKAFDTTFRRNATHAPELNTENTQKKKMNFGIEQITLLRHSMSTCEFDSAVKIQSGIKEARYPICGSENREHFHASGGIRMSDLMQLARCPD